MLVLLYNILKKVRYASASMFRKICGMTAKYGKSSSKKKIEDT